MKPSESIYAAVLGALQVRAGTTEVATGPPRRQAVLGFLVVKAGTVVSSAEVIDAVWGEAAPVSVTGNLHTYVSDLRRLLDSATGGNAAHTPLRTSGSGYLLDLADENIDVRLFERELNVAAQFAERGGQAEAIATWKRALRRWRGTPLAGIEAPYADVERSRLDNLRLAAMTDLVNALFSRGTEADTRVALTTLEAALEEYPLHQRFAELRIRILHGRGRRAEALAQYDRTRRQLADELGIDPGEPLRAAHDDVLDGAITTPGGIAGPAAPSRAQPVAAAPLPAAPGQLAGRAAELAALSRSAAVVGEAKPRVLTIDGPPGIGKTALALRFAHDIAAGFPDGCYHLDLRGTHGSRPPLSELDAVRQLLAAVGGNLPPGTTDELGTYRSLLTNKRLLLILDDAQHADQVRSLLPPGANALVLVTSRRRLAGLLGREGATRIALGPLPDDAARAMLGDITGQDPAVHELAGLCEGLPLALRHATALLADGDSPAGLVAGLRDERTRVARLSPGDRRAEATVEQAFRRSTRDLDEDGWKLISLLGGERGTVITVNRTAALTGWPATRARRALDRLAVDSLLDWSTRDHYRMAPLLRAYTVGLRARQPSTA